MDGGLVHGEAVLIEEEVVAVEMNGTVVQREDTYLVEEFIPLLEGEDLNIRLLVMILVRNITLVDQKDTQVEEEEVNIRTVIKDPGILTLEEMSTDRPVIQLVKG